MGKCCCVPYCKSGYKSTVEKNYAAGLRNPSTFSAPKDPEILRQWNVAICRKDREISTKDPVCELHFAEECVQRFNETKLSDGTIFRLERERPILKKKAVPTIFPNYPHYLITNKQKPPVDHKTKLSKLKKEKPISKKEAVPTIFPNLPLCLISNKQKPPVDCAVNQFKEKNLDYSLDINNEQTEEQFLFNNLIGSLDEVKKPSDWWSLNVVKNYVAIVCWNQSYEIIKKIIVDSDLCVKVFLKGQRVASADIAAVVHSVEHLSSIMQIVDDFKICQNLESRNSKTIPFCGGYVEGGLQLCKYCSISENNRSLQKKKTDALLKNEKLNNKLKTSARGIERQKNKIECLKKSKFLLISKCAKAKEAALNAEIATLPLPQQRAIKDCFHAMLLQQKDLRE